MSDNALVDRLDQIIRLIGGATNPITLGEWYVQWYEHYKKPNLKPSSLKGITLSWNKHIKDVLADKRMIEISSLDLQQFVNKIVGLRAKRITLGIISNMYRFAILNNELKINPCQSVIISGCGTKGRGFTLEEQKQILDAMQGFYFAPQIIAYLNTGLRRCELLALSWSDIDVTNRIISVNKNYDTVSKKIVNYLKTTLSTRKIPITDAMLGVIKKLPKDKEYPFYCRTITLNKRFHQLCERLGFDGTIHSLRHTFSNNCLRMGISMKQVQLWLGHSKYKTTADIYTDIDMDVFEKNAILFNNFDKMFNNSDKILSNENVPPLSSDDTLQIDDENDYEI